MVESRKGKARAQLTAVAVKNLTRPGRYADGDRLYLWVRKNGRRDWIFRYQSPGGRKRDMSLGNAEIISLANARVAAARARAQLVDRIDPLDERDAKTAAAKQAHVTRTAASREERMTLLRVARAYHEQIETKFRNRKHRDQWINSIEQHLPSELLHRPINQVPAHELVDAFVKIERSVPETGRRVRQRIAVIFDDAIMRGLVDRSPMVGVARRVRDLVGKRETGSFAALDYTDAPAFMAALKAQEGISARALELVLLTAARTREVIGARWEEFDLKKRVWTVPATRMKAGEAHLVFLSPSAVALLRKMPVVADTPFVFASPFTGGASISNMAMLTTLTRMGWRDRTTVHGLRSTFSTWANECSAFKPDVIEAVLAHRESDRVRAAYNRATFDVDRRKLLAAWGRYVQSA